MEYNRLINLWTLTSGPGPFQRSRTPSFQTVSGEISFQNSFFLISNVRKSEIRKVCIGIDPRFRNTSSFMHCRNWGGWLSRRLRGSSQRTTQESTLTTYSTSIPRQLTTTLPVVYDGGRVWPRLVPLQYRELRSSFLFWRVNSIFYLILLNSNEDTRRIKQCMFFMIPPQMLFGAI